MLYNFIYNTVNNEYKSGLYYYTQYGLDTRSKADKRLGGEVAWIYIQHLIAVIISLPHI